MIPYQAENRVYGASDHIRALVSGYAECHWKNKILVMLQAFIDDSASDTGDQRLFLAGYVNTADQWIAFSNAWEEALKEHPAIEYFKMSEAHSLKGQFERWQEKDRDAKVSRLAKVIRDFDVLSIQVSVSRTDYNRIIRPVAPHGLGNAYFTLFYGVIITLTRTHQQMGITMPVDFIFDEQGGMGQQTALFYDYVKSQQIPELQGLLGVQPIFRDDKKVMPLQAADMLAWKIRREHEYPNQQHSIKPWDFYKEKTYHAVAEMNEEMLVGLAEKMKKVPGITLTQRKAQWKKMKDVIIQRQALGLNPRIPQNSFHRFCERFATFIRLNFPRVFNKLLFLRKP